jgi:hypothetical protein
MQAMLNTWKFGSAICTITSLLTLADAHGQHPPPRSLEGTLSVVVSYEPWEGGSGKVSFRPIPIRLNLLDEHSNQARYHGSVSGLIYKGQYTLPGSAVWISCFMEKEGDRGNRAEDYGSDLFFGLQWDRANNKFSSGGYFSNVVRHRYCLGPWYIVENGVPAKLPQTSGVASIDNTNVVFALSSTSLYQSPYDGGSPKPDDPFNLQGVHVKAYSVTINGVLKGVSEVPSGLQGMVLRVDAQGRPRGVLAGARVEILNGPSMVTGIRGYGFLDLSPGQVSVRASMAGYETLTRTFNLEAGSIRTEHLYLSRDTGAGIPLAFNLESPNGTHFVKGIPGDIDISATVKWNGTPGQADFKIGSVRYPATLEAMGGGRSRVRATLSTSLLDPVVECGEIVLELQNAEGKRGQLFTGTYLHPFPEFLAWWYGTEIGWAPYGLQRTHTRSYSWTPFQWKYRGLELDLSVGLDNHITYDPLAGSFGGGIAGGGGLSAEVKFMDVEVLGEAQLQIGGSTEATFQECLASNLNRQWMGALTGTLGVRMPAVEAVQAFFPTFYPLIEPLQKVPGLKKVLNVLRLGLFFKPGATLTGTYGGGSSGGADCGPFAGTDTLKGTVTVGFEGQGVLKWKESEAGLYVGGSGTPAIELCPELKWLDLKIQAYIGVFASTLGFAYNRQISTEVSFFDASSKLSGAALAALNSSDAEAGRWEPIGDRLKEWGPANVLGGPRPSGIGAASITQLGAGRRWGEAERVVENVLRNPAPAVVSLDKETMILFVLQDPEKPWHASSDIGVATGGAEGKWTLSRIVDDFAADFSPNAVRTAGGAVLATWLRVAGDASDATGPADLAPRLEVVAAWFDPEHKRWSAPIALTDNEVADRHPLVVSFGGMSGVVWVQNQAGEMMGNVDSGDRLLFARWNGAGWEPAETLWEGAQGIVDLASGSEGEGGWVVFSVDTDGDLDTQSDLELYACEWVSEMWSDPTRLTEDQVEDRAVTLVSPGGAARCVWIRAGEVVSSPLRGWDPKPVFEEVGASNQASSLVGVTLSGGAAVAYTVQLESGVDVMAAFYDEATGLWSQPRPLTSDDAVEGGVAVAAAGEELLAVYARTETVRSDIEITVDGDSQLLKDIPQPGRTDLWLVRNAPRTDLALEMGSLEFVPANPTPGTVVTVSCVVVNSGDVPLREVKVAFYDGDPAAGGVLIAEPTVGLLVGGARRRVEVLWTVPATMVSREIHAVVDTAEELAGKNWGNNRISRRTVLPDLAVSTAWSQTASDRSVILIVRVVNQGSVMAGETSVSWHYGSREGPLIGSHPFPPLEAGGVREVHMLWEFSDKRMEEAFVTAVAVVDGKGLALDADRTNNERLQTVRVIPSWVPRIDRVEEQGGGRIRLWVEARGALETELVVEGTERLEVPTSWEELNSVTVAGEQAGWFEVEVLATKTLQYFRVSVGETDAVESDASDAFSPLTKNVSHIVSPGAVGSVEDLVPGAGTWRLIVTGDEDTSEPSTFCLARRFGEGRVVAIGHDGILFSDVFDNAQFLRNVVEWLNQGAQARLAFSGGHREFARADNSVTLTTAATAGGFAVKQLAGAITSEGLAAVDVLVVGNAWGAFKASEVKAVEDFVSAGGGLLLVGVGWSWLAYNAGATLDNFPMAILAAPYGVRWGAEIITDPTDSYQGSPIFRVSDVE